MVRAYDAAVEKLGADLMAGLKPEDKVLVMITRIEAFLHSLAHRPAAPLPADFDLMAVASHPGRLCTKPEELEAGRTLYVPDFGPATGFLRGYLENEYGVPTKALPKMGRAREEQALLADMERLLRQVSDAAGNNPAFAADLAALHATADRFVRAVQGGNLRYRFAKCVDMGRSCDAVLSLAPRYENAAMIMDMRGLREATAAPLMQVHLDGDWDESAWTRVRSFLHYCGKKERKAA